MKIKIREIEYELKSVPYKKWVDAEEKGLSLDNFSKQKKCDNCEGKKQINKKPCPSCNGVGSTMKASKKEIYLFAEVTLVHSGVDISVIEDLSIEEIGDILPELANFMAAKKSPSIKTT